MDYLDPEMKIGPDGCQTEMVLIPAGEFLMGSDPNQDAQAYSNEQPQFSLYLSDYYLAKTPVTTAQYLAFVRATDHERPEYWKGGKIPKGKEDHPIVYVTWHEAVEYCTWLTELTGKLCCLPTEAKWEKGARGADGRVYPWGDQFDGSRCNTSESGIRDTTSVYKYPNGASPYGLLDMTGNVWEWTSSLYEPYPYDPKDGRENPSSQERRVLRGGSFLNNEDFARCAYRSYLPYVRDWNCGYRVCVVSGSD